MDTIRKGSALSVLSFYLATKQDVSGAMYIRWGRSECPSGSTLVYEGFVGGPYYNNPGGMSNYVCLPNEPDYVTKEPLNDNIISVIMSTEYKTDNQVFSRNTHHYDAPCVLCIAVGMTSVLTIPGKARCPGSLKTEYIGYMMAAQKSEQHQQEAICIDENTEVMLGSDDDAKGAALYFVVADCNHSFIPCEPYLHLVPIVCSVCSS